MSINKKRKLIILITGIAVVLCALMVGFVLLLVKTNNFESSSSYAGGKNIQLLKPENVRVENGVLKWDTVKGADYYIISYADEEIKVETTEFSIVELLDEHGEDYIRISACSRQNDVKTSDFAGYYLSFEDVNEDENLGLEFVLLPEGEGYSVRAVNAFYGVGVITIPSRYKGKPVTKIENKAFYALKESAYGESYNVGITAFEIPDTITEIGEEAFCGCVGVKEMVIPESCVSIGAKAFRKMYGLETISLPSGLKNVSQGLFKECRKLENISLPDGLTSIGDGAFYRCIVLKNVLLPDSLTSIGKEAFAVCIALESITLPDGIISIERETFSGCKALRSVKFPANLKSIDDRAFNYCTSLISVKLPNDVNSIGISCFANTGIDFIELPDSLEKIGHYAFNQCESLIGVRINKNLSYIGASVFGDCIRLAEVINESSVETKTLLGDKTGAITERLLVNKNGGARQIKEENGFYVFENNGEKILIAPIDKNIENAELPDGVAVIRRNAFYKCANLKSVYYPSTLKTVEKYAFKDCNKLKEISADDVAVISSVEYVDGASALNAGSELNIKGEKVTELVIPASIKEIKDYTFKWFSKIISVRFDGAITLGKDSFSGQVKIVYVKKMEMLSGDVKESRLLSSSSNTLLIEEEISKAYFCGNESRWGQLSDERKAPASGKTVYFYRMTQPTISGNYWNFDDNGAVKEW